MDDGCHIGPQKMNMHGSLSIEFLRNFILNLAITNVSCIVMVHLIASDLIFLDYPIRFRKSVERSDVQLDPSDQNQNLCILYQHDS